MHIEATVDVNVSGQVFQPCPLAGYTLAVVLQAILSNHNHYTMHFEGP